MDKFAVGASDSSCEFGDKAFELGARAESYQIGEDKRIALNSPHLFCQTWARIAVSNFPLIVSR